VWYSRDVHDSWMSLPSLATRRQNRSGAFSRTRFAAASSALPKQHVTMTTKSRHRDACWWERRSVTATSDVRLPLDRHQLEMDRGGDHGETGKLGAVVKERELRNAALTVWIGRGSRACRSTTARGLGLTCRRGARPRRLPPPKVPQTIEASTVVQFFFRS